MFIASFTLDTSQLNLPVERLQTEWSEQAKVNLFCLRLDLTDLAVSGNKWFKLAHNIAEAKSKGISQVLTFGGAFSNHIFSTAHECARQGLNSVGVIRGEELNPNANQMLEQASKAGMKFCFVSRSAYRNKYHQDQLAYYQSEFGEYFLIPEGGSNQNGVLGCEAIGEHIARQGICFNDVFVACGTSATCSGIIRGLHDAHNRGLLNFRPKVHGVSMFPKPDKPGWQSWMKPELEGYLGDVNYPYQLHESGYLPAYGRLTEGLAEFISEFHTQSSILLDPVYTGKLVYYLKHLCEVGQFRPQSNLLFVHTGGLHGWLGFESPPQLSGTIKNRLSSV
ncbi:1-aminocyclopropane-1-carboxylate deaminase/D-cysteine desulfhydrase [Litoribacillus peritrichatus]|uniref:Pyridoxal-phosphate dependent enzyme n=1 Tax=Litoribacillus peritrichatus TaxID=718191 RepID=A0ABP7M4S4_9GAMM